MLSGFSDRNVGSVSSVMSYKRLARYRGFIFYSLFPQCYVVLSGFSTDNMRSVSSVMRYKG